jgi:hypothetical protein
LTPPLVLLKIDEQTKILEEAVMKKWRIYGLLVISLIIGIIMGVVIDRFEINKLNSKLDEKSVELKLLQGTTEFIFGQNLKVFDIEYSVVGISGKIQNISTLPMKHVEIWVTTHDSLGQYLGTSTASSINLWPSEISDWGVIFRYDPYNYASHHYTIYAVGDMPIVQSPSD